MNSIRLAAFAAAAAFSLGAVPALAQSSPFVAGDFVEVTGITVDEGHALDYQNWLATYVAKEEAYSRSQGWMISTEFLANVNGRKGEPDLYIVRRYKSLPDATEGERRSKMLNDYMKTTDAQQDAAAGDRAKYRHVEGSQLLQVMVPR